MCEIFAGQDPKNYQYQTRSIRLHGRSTSIRLETTFWRLLEEVATSQQMSVPQFISKVHDEVVELHGSASNFTSLLRCAVVIYLESVNKPGVVATQHSRPQSAIPLAL